MKQFRKSCSTFCKTFNCCFIEILYTALYSDTNEEKLEYRHSNKNYSNAQITKLQVHKYIANNGPTSALYISRMH